MKHSVTISHVKNCYKECKDLVQRQFIQYAFHPNQLQAGEVSKKTADCKKDCRRAAHSFFKIGCLFSLFLFSCPSLAPLCLLILLLLLMSGNIHPNPGSIFPCSVCAGNVTWQGKSVQCYACSKWVHLRCSQLSLSKFRALGSSHSWSCSLCHNTVTPPPWTPPTCIPPLWNLGPPPLLMLLSRLTLISKPLIPICPLYISFLFPPPPSLTPGYPSAPPAFSPPLTLSGFFNGMLEV